MAFRLFVFLRLQNEGFYISNIKYSKLWILLIYEILKLYPESNQEQYPLVVRENTLKRLLEKGNYTNKYIKKAVLSNSGYKNLPSYSPGFDNL